MKQVAQRAILVRRDATGAAFLFAFGVITLLATSFSWVWGRVVARGAESQAPADAAPPLRLQIQVGEAFPLVAEGAGEASSGNVKETDQKPGVEMRIRASGTISQSVTSTDQAVGNSNRQEDSKRQGDTVAESASSDAGEVWVEATAPAEVWVAEEDAFNSLAPPIRSDVNPDAYKKVTSEAPKEKNEAPTLLGAAPDLVAQASPSQRAESPVSGGAMNESLGGANAGTENVRIVLESPGPEEQVVLRIKSLTSPLIVRTQPDLRSVLGSVGENSLAEDIRSTTPAVPRTTPDMLRLIRENLELNQSWAVAACRQPSMFAYRESPQIYAPATVVTQASPANGNIAASGEKGVVLTSGETPRQAAPCAAVSSSMNTAWEWPGRTSPRQSELGARSENDNLVLQLPDEAGLQHAAQKAAGENPPSWRIITPRPQLSRELPDSALSHVDHGVQGTREEALSKVATSEGAARNQPQSETVYGTTEKPAQAGRGENSGPAVREFSQPTSSTTASLTSLRAEEGAGAANQATLTQPNVQVPTTVPFEIVEESGELTVIVRRSKLLRTQVDVYRTAVVDSSICDVVQFTPREISILGKSQGATHVTFWFQDERYRPVTYLVRVTPDPEVEKSQVERYELLESHLAKLFPESKVDLIVVGDKLVVKGQARDAAEAAQIMAVIRGELVRGRSVAEGRAADPVGSEAAGQTAPAIQVINMLRIPGPPQVALKVKIAELNRTAARNFGVDMALNFDQGKFLIQSLLNISAGGSASVIGNFDGGDLQFGLHYLEEHGVVRLLSEPTLVTLSGRPATFIAGGEFAVPTVVGVNGVGAVTTDFRAFGAIITFLPTVLDKDLIRLEVAPEFSQIDRKNMVNGTPGLRTRAVTTTVEMREGQTLAIAGLLDDSMTGNNQGDLPIFNQIFGRRSMSRNETELIILVTPEIVHPMEPEEVPPLPGFDVTEPTNHEFYLKGHLEGRPTQEYDSTTWPRLRRRYNAGGPARISGPYGHGD